MGTKPIKVLHMKSAALCLPPPPRPAGSLSTHHQGPSSSVTYQSRQELGRPIHASSSSQPLISSTGRISLTSSLEWFSGLHIHLYYEPIIYESALLIMHLKCALYICLWGAHGAP